MKSLILLAVTFLLGCSPDHSSCSKDSDCKGSRICQDGECVGSPSPTSTGTTNPPPSGLACGVIDIQCNCLYTSAYPGAVTSTSLCQSGRHQFFACTGSCGGGVPWGTVCYCN